MEKLIGFQLMMSVFRRGTRPCVAIMPKIPQKEAGMRMEPAPSVPCATGFIPAATDAAAPPLDAPLPISMFQGLRQ